ncbi:N-acetyltransferase [Deinococcus psychrotolerans]|uniref:N-acetyltransferase n=1 Tax=Deinococcus psychrotolerans TaxID=2489213 RepID=A0A3G8YCI1_9DEIO|nr:GNAT family protein [Deinococcus psychrotolerans]AZI43092.1 N-acetyltransferase [Deinococcus psychrotolerans]
MARLPSTPLPLTLRPQTAREALLLSLWLTDPAAEWRQWDAPYLLPAPDAHREEAEDGEADQSHHERLIFVGEQAVGLVTRTPEAPSSGGWWELGILIYDPQHWGGGFGTRALRDWTALTFQETGAHVLTLSTWSGNARMVRAATRVGYAECARVREARLWQGKRYASVRLDLLRREWEESLKFGGDEQV